MKSLLNRLLALIVFISVIVLSPVVSGANDYGDGLVSPWTYEDGTYYPITDMAGLLSDEEVESLCEKIQEFEKRYSTSIVLLTVNDLGDRTAQQYADDFYDYYNFGNGSSHEGLIFIIDMGSRSWQIETTGNHTIEKFTDNTLDRIGEDCSKSLRDGDYYGCFDTFISCCSRVMAGFTLMHGIISLILGLLLALIPLGIFIKELNTVSRASGAGNYMTKGLSLTVQKDLFLHHHISRTKIEHNSGSGGSSTHTGSSGTSHGGTGGHF